jgi:hypothetical protein
VTADELVESLVADESLTYATLSGPRARGEDVPRRLTVRPVRVGGERRYQWTSHFATRTSD